MTLVETANEIASLSDDPVVQKISQIMKSWRNDQTTTRELEATLERYIGNSWIGADSEHEEMYQLWSAFRDSAIRGIGGMTMNERLWWFDLMDRFRGANGEEEKGVIYAKLHAAP